MHVSNILFGLAIVSVQGLVIDPTTRVPSARYVSKENALSTRERADVDSDDKVVYKWANPGKNGKRAETDSDDLVVYIWDVNAKEDKETDTDDVVV
ncbi:hypothetical protein GGS24DRAFT_305466 [Hypoxylon argillaceum]|nr:hypothetical protein GGS24DRAFT_305466 [Hypoxylon argillaceum]